MLTKHPASFDIADYLVLISKFVSVENDEPDIHPKAFCKGCYTGMKSPRNKKWVPTAIWAPHRRSQTCVVCSHSKKMSVGGRPSKKKSTGRPRIDRSLHATLDSLKANSRVPDIAIDDEVLFKERFWVPNDSQFCCRVCECVFVCPVSTPCQHLFCMSCVQNLFGSDSRVNISCPTCHSHVHFQSLTPAPTYFHNILKKSDISCKQCNTNLTYDIATHHSHPSHHPTITHTDHKQTTDNLISQLTPQQKEEIGTVLLREKLRTSNDGATAVFRTKGQPLVTKLITKPRISSADSTPSTRRRRSMQLAAIRDEISHSPDVQFRHEVSRAHKAGALDDPSSSVKINDIDMVNMRSMLRLSWKMTRKLKSWLKEHNIASDCEKKVRAQESKLIGDNLEGEWVPLQFHNEERKETEIIKTPLVKVSSLERKVMSLLDEYEKLNLLSFDDTGGERQTTASIPLWRL
ncbi:V(D)J recombination-activating protein 1-like [Strongylocentrotus purpuratus]|uniref:RING-type domain-containing protein n=1 Tax=Strongylocentrotus purpuratus TaxID=7668 RepID=A0A7M7HGL5_STRPU|nr:V(D)J recombination-activating protein 1-like [Strongylocentrotus purpuratus]